MANKSRVTEELKSFIEDNDDVLSKQTLSTYINDYKRFRSEMTNRKNIANLTQREIIDIVTNTELSKPNLLNIAIVILKWKNKEHSRLLKYRVDLLERTAEKQAKKNQDIIEKSNTSYDDLMTALETATGSDYILFYLLINLNTRNNDLIIKLADPKEEINDTDNFIVVGRNKATYIRNNYKTKKSYGAKTDVIRDVKFHKAVTTLLNDGYPYAFLNNKYKPYKQTEMGKFIASRFKKYLPESSLSQAVIYKIIQQEAESSGNIKMMKNIADSRGHSLSCQI